MAAQAQQASSRAIVPKGPSVASSARDHFDRDAALTYLFSLPLPPYPPGRREYPAHTPLGRIMRLKGLMIRDIERMDGAPNQRKMSDYLAGRSRISDHHRRALARGLGVDARIF